MNDIGHVEYMGYIITRLIYWVLGNTIQYRSMSYGVIQYAPLDSTILFREVHIANIRIVYIISNTDRSRRSRYSSNLSTRAFVMQWDLMNYF